MFHYTRNANAAVGKNTVISAMCCVAGKENITTQEWEEEGWKGQD